jgi:hypothetical protein
MSLGGDGGDGEGGDILMRVSAVNAHGGHDGLRGEAEDDDNLEPSDPAPGNRGSMPCLGNPALHGPIQSN